MFGQDMAQQGKILASIAQLADTGRLRPRLDTEHFSLERAAEAHAKFESGHAKEKSSSTWRREAEGLDATWMALANIVPSRLLDGA
jgi:hypothetical protein